jgi:hypothetical protein
VKEGMKEDSAIHIAFDRAWFRPSPVFVYNATFEPTNAESSKGGGKNCGSKVTHKYLDRQAAENHNTDVTLVVAYLKPWKKRRNSW